MHPITVIPVFADPLCLLDPPGRVDAVGRGPLAALVERLEGAPAVRCGLALSGALLGWLDGPGAPWLERLVKLCARGQVEPLCAPRGGAALPLLHERDALVQLQVQRRALLGRLGVPVRGAVLPAGAWDPSLIAPISRAGLGWVLVPEALFLVAGGRAEALPAWGTAERGGVTVGVLPAVSLPVALPLPALRARAEAGQRCVTVLAPIGEAAALVERLAGAAGAFRTGVPVQVVERLPSGGRLAPAAGTASDAAPYLLGPEAARAWLDAATGRLPDGLAALGRAAVGPPVEAVLARHGAARRLHGALSDASALVAALRREAARRPELTEPTEAAAAHLFAAQGWAAMDPAPGGGLRDPAVRQAAWQALGQARAAVEAALGPPAPVEASDADGDGFPELRVRTPHGRFTVAPGLGGALTEWWVPGVGNLVNTHDRVAEGWHRLDEEMGLPVLDGEPGADVSGASQASLEGDVVLDVDDPSMEVPMDAGGATFGRAAPAPVVAVDVDAPEDDTDLPTDEGAAPALSRGALTPLEELVPAAWLDGLDRVPRLALLDRFLGPATPLSAFARGQADEEGDFAGAPYRVERAGPRPDGAVEVVLAREGVLRGAHGEGLLRLTRTLVFSSDEPVLRVDWELVNRSREVLSSRFAVEINTGLDGRDGPARGLRLPGRPPIGAAEPAVIGDAPEAAFAWTDFGVMLRLRPDRPAGLLHLPVHAPVPAAGAPRAAYQGSAVLLWWPLRLWGEERARFGLELRLGRRPA